MINKHAAFCEECRFIAVFKQPYMDMSETVLLFYLLTIF